MRKFYFIMLAFFIFIGCSEGDNYYDEPTSVPDNSQIEIPTASLTPCFDAKGGEVFIEFVAKSDWTASVSNARAENWCSVSPLTGNAGKATLVIRTTVNDTYDERNATVIIRAGSDSKTIIVVQKPQNALLVSSNKIELEKEGGEFSLEVKANVKFEYFIEEGIDWISTSMSDTRSLNITQLHFNVAPNLSGYKREAGITITDGTLTELVSVYQEGEIPQLTVTANQQVFDCEGGNLKVEVTSNINYDMVLPDVSWITEDKERNQSTHTLYFSISPNETNEDRQAEIVFNEKDGGLSEVVNILQYGQNKDPETEIRRFLINLYNDTNGDNWKINNNWCSDAPVEQWYGVNITQNEEGKTLVTLSLSSNNLVGSIDLSDCTYIEWLSCGGNTLSSIDVTNCTSLKILQCDNNELKELLVDGSSLTDIGCSSNKLTTLNLKNCSKIESVNCSFNDIVDLQADGLPSLKNLYCPQCQLKELNVSNCLNLTYLYCDSNPLEIIDVSNTSLDDGFASNLNWREPAWPNLKVVKFRNCSKLKTIAVQNIGSLQLLDFTDCNNMTYLYCNNVEQLEFLEIKGCNSLERLTVYKSGVHLIDVSGYDKLIEISCADNICLTHFYADICTSLVSLFCHNNHLAVLNLDGCTSLDVLNCSNNQLTSLETSTCHKLRNIMCDNNLIEQISYPRSLENFSCINNRITAKVPSWFSELVDFRCDYLYEYTGYDYDNEKWLYKMHTYGWWYEGEPDCGPVYHY
mgnify:CR=1 FL=1